MDLLPTCEVTGSHCPAGPTCSYKKQMNFLTALLLRGPSQCLCTRALSTLATPL